MNQLITELAAVGIVDYEAGNRPDDPTTYQLIASSGRKFEVFKLATAHKLRANEVLFVAMAIGHMASLSNKK